MKNISSKPVTLRQTNKPVRASSRESLLDVAENLFALHGYYGTSTHDVAHQAGVKQSLIAYHFGSKENLYRAIIERRAAPYCQLKLDALAVVLAKQKQDVSLEAILGAFIRPVFDQFRDDWNEYRSYTLLLSQGAHLARSPTLHECFDRQYVLVVERFREAIAACLPNPDSDAINGSLEFLHGALATFVGVGAGVYFNHLFGNAAGERWVDQLISFCAAGCRQLAKENRQKTRKAIMAG